MPRKSVWKVKQGGGYSSIRTLPPKNAHRTIAHVDRISADGRRIIRETRTVYVDRNAPMDIAHDIVDPFDQDAPMDIDRDVVNVEDGRNGDGEQDTQQERNSQKRTKGSMAKGFKTIVRSMPLEGIVNLTLVCRHTIPFFSTGQCIATCFCTRCCD